MSWTLTSGLCWVLPASAGMILVSLLDRRVMRSAPRICGDDPKIGLWKREHEWCSPHLRG